jgi:hypothetical protein
MGTNARIEPGGYVTIDVAAWLEQRTGGPDEDLTLDLHAWAANHDDTGEPTDEAGSDPDQSPPRRDWVTAARTWCHHRGHQLPEPDLIAHIETRLDAEVWILRATIGDRYQVAVVGINHDPPTVYAEACTDPWDWFDADSVDIICPGGHGWTWRTGRELVTANGSFTTLTVVFGANLDAPFTTCPTCTSHQLGQRAEPCGCDGAPWIVCPTCGGRCDVELPTY